MRNFVDVHSREVPSKKAVLDKGWVQLSSCLSDMVDILGVSVPP